MYKLFDHFVIQPTLVAVSGKEGRIGSMDVVGITNRGEAIEQANRPSWMSGVRVAQMGQRDHSTDSLQIVAPKYMRVPMSLVVPSECEEFTARCDEKQFGVQMDIKLQT